MYCPMASNQNALGPTRSKLICPFMVAAVMITMSIKNLFLCHPKDQSEMNFHWPALVGNAGKKGTI